MVDSSSKSAANCCMVFLNFIIGYLFYRYSYIRSRECYYLGEFSYWFGFIILMSAIIIIILVWPCQCCKCVFQEIIDNLFDVTISVQSTTYFIFLIAFTILIFFREPCGKLRTLVMIYLIVVYSLMLIGGCVGFKLINKQQKNELQEA
ncbi:hypothetical protein pb186bvf_001228 [Paramecium bursaria]